MESQPLNSERPKNPFYCVFHSLVAFLSNLNPCQLSSLRLSFNLDNECSQEAICPIFTSLTLFRHINTISSPPLLYNHCPGKKNPPLRHPPPHLFPPLPLHYPTLRFNVPAVLLFWASAAFCRSLDACPNDSTRSHLERPWCFLAHFLRTFRVLLGALARLSPSQGDPILRERSMSSQTAWSWPSCLYRVYFLTIFIDFYWRTAWPSQGACRSQYHWLLLRREFYWLSDQMRRSEVL